MIRPYFRVFHLALLTCRARALRSLPSEETIPEAGSYRQRLENFQDTQYFGEITVGGQVLRAVVDTGSYELVLFSKNCGTCGVAALYNESASRLFVHGRRQHEHTYGSGTCQTDDGRDEVDVGPLRAGNQWFWMGMQCEMALLQEASFNAIVGLGPPGQPQRSAEMLLEKLRSLEAWNATAGGGNMSEVTRRAMLSAQQDIDDAPSKPALVENLGITTFSACFGRQPGAPGWLIWNDTRPDGRGDAVTADVVGKVSWAVRVADVGLNIDIDASEPYVMGCQTGCGALLDTGTSFLGVPTDIYTAVREHIVENNNDCSDLRRFPTLTFNIGGNAMYLPPDTYVGAMTGQVASGLQGAVGTDHLGGAAGCQLLLMDLGTEMTQFGPMLILGIPFFRHYHTTFDLGRGAAGRSLHFAPADAQCRPAPRGPAPASLRQARRPLRPRLVDVSRLRAPGWLRSRRGAPAPDL